MSSQKVYGAYERMSDLRGEDLHKTAENMFHELDSLCYNIWDEGDDEPSGIFWEVSSRIPLCDGLSERVRSLIEMWNENMIDEDRLIITWQKTGNYEVQMYFDHSRTIEDEFRDLTKEETLEFLRAIIPLDPYNNNGWALSGRNHHYPEYKSVYGKNAQKSAISGFALEAVKLMKSGVFRPRACL